MAPAGPTHQGRGELRDQTDPRPPAVNAPSPPHH
ncbi:hypothetical protein M2160_006024 [Streptomyces sp. SAI-117]|nr:hypothetical protein [Streptomyces sp. SAI-117]